MRRLWQRVLLFVGIVAALGALRTVGFFDWLTLSYVQQEVHHLRALVDEHFVLASCGYIFLLIVATALFIPVTALATVLSGYLFGIVVGTVYTIIGVTIGSVLVLLTVRYWLGVYLQKHYRRFLGTFNNELDHYGAYYILMMHFLPMTPTVIINILAGLSSLSWTSFAWSTAVGIVPGTIVHTIIGQEFLTITSLSGLLSWKTVVALVLLALLVLIPMLLQRRVRLRKLV
jgi:uncharacterized membrane protein YdjX (TVP38/TMEM64 family)